MIYAVNTRTKKHQVVANPEMAPPGKEIEGKWYGDRWLMLEADVDGWIPHTGNECPLPLDQPCECKTKSGDSMRFSAAGSVIGWKQAVAYYRPILDAKLEDIKTDDDAWDEAMRIAYPEDYEPLEWDGESWPPPIGCTLETWATDRKGIEAEVLAVRRGYVIGCAVESAMPGFLMRKECRPLRSKEDREIDRIKDIIADEFDADRRDCYLAARALYSAGYRKQEAS